MPARLIIRRPKQSVDRFRRYTIMLNGRDVATIKRGEDLSLEIPAGPYVAMARIDWCGSRPLAFKAAEGETVQLEVGSNLGGWKSLAAVLYVFAWPTDYLYLRMASPYEFEVITP